MTLTFLVDSRVMLTTWENKIAFKSYFKGDQLENVGVSEDLIDNNIITISHNKNSFNINKNSVKIDSDSS
jgi:hypothetical protein